jgi:hypothetical protein
MRLGLLDDRIKRGWVADRQLAEHLAIQFDSRRDQRRDEPVVVNVALAQRRSEPRDPQRTEMPLSLPAIPISVDARLADEFQRRAVQRPRRRPKPAGGLENSFSFAAMGRAAPWPDECPRRP